jgi:hypothetical protein
LKSEGHSFSRAEGANLISFSAAAFGGKPKPLSQALLPATIDSRMPAER